MNLSIKALLLISLMMMVVLVLLPSKKSSCESNKESLNITEGDNNWKH